MSSPEILSKYTPGKGERERDDTDLRKERKLRQEREPEREGIRK